MIQHRHSEACVLDSSIPPFTPQTVRDPTHTFGLFLPITQPHGNDICLDPNQFQHRSLHIRLTKNTIGQRQREQLQKLFRYGFRITRAKGRTVRLPEEFEITVAGASWEKNARILMGLWEEELFSIDFKLHSNKLAHLAADQQPIDGRSAVYRYHRRAAERAKVVSVTDRVLVRCAPEDRARLVTSQHDVPEANTNKRFFVLEAPSAKLLKLLQEEYNATIIPNTPLVVSTRSVEALGFEVQSVVGGKKILLGVGQRKLELALIWDPIPPVPGSPMRDLLANIVTRTPSSGGPQAQELTGAGVCIAIFDQGIQGSLPELRHACGDGWSYDGVSSPWVDDSDSAHGTMCAGIVSGRATHRYGGGVAPGAELLSVKVSEQFELADMIEGVGWLIDYADQHPTKTIIAMHSWGSYSLDNALLDPLQDEALTETIQDASETGIVSAFAAGNHHHETLPMCEPNTIWLGAQSLKEVLVVGAYNHDSGGKPVVADYSSRGPGLNSKETGVQKPDLLGPAPLRMNYLHRINKLAGLNGWSWQTSGANAFVCGALALLAEHQDTVGGAKDAQSLFGMLRAKCTPLTDIADRPLCPEAQGGGALLRFFV